MRKKVLMIIPRLAGGGAERVVSNLTLQLQDKYEMDVLLDYDEVEYPCAGNILQLNPGVKKAVGKLGHYRTYIRKFLCLYRMKREKYYDCYISHSKVSHVLNVLTGKHGKRTILVLHNKSTNLQDSSICGFMEWFARHYYQKADVLIAVSEGVRQEYIEKFGILPEKIVSIWNGNDIQKLQEQAIANLSLQQEEWLWPNQTVSTMGRFCRQKGQRHLVRAFSRVVEKMPNARLLLLGEGPLWDRLIRIVKTFHIEKNVVFCGFQENPFALLGRSNVFVFPSLWEGFGYALEEAICCGVPCISSDFEYGAREILHYEKKECIKGPVYTDYGVLVPVCPESVEDTAPLTAEEEMLADSILEVLTNEDYCKKVCQTNEGRLEEFSLDRMGEEWSKVIG